MKNCKDRCGELGKYFQEQMSRNRQRGHLSLRRTEGQLEWMRNSWSDKRGFIHNFWNKRVEAGNNRNDKQYLLEETRGTRNSWNLWKKTSGVIAKNKEQLKTQLENWGTTSGTDEKNRQQLREQFEGTRNHVRNRSEDKEQLNCGKR